MIDAELERLAALNRKLGETEVDAAIWPQILDALPDGLIVIDHAARICLVNVQIELMLGHHRRRLIGEPVHVLLSPDLALQHAEHIARFFEQPTARPMNLAKHLPALHASGRTVMVQISIGPLISEAGIFGLAIVRRVSGGGG